MANLDSTNKRRSGTGVFHLFTIPHDPDGVHDVADRMNATLLYSGIAPGAPPAGYWKPQGLLMGVYRMKWVS